jgi:hypothetical protein
MTKKQKKTTKEDIREIKEMEYYYESLYSLPDEWLKDCGLLDEWGRPYRYRAYPQKEIEARFYNNNG